MDTHDLAPEEPLSETDAWAAGDAAAEQRAAEVAERKALEQRFRAAPELQAWYRRHDRRVARWEREDRRHAERVAREAVRRAFATKQHAALSLPERSTTHADRAPRRQPAASGTRTSRGSPGVSAGSPDEPHSPAAAPLGGAS